ncbi:putative mitochondrial protein AtMg00310 [Silene latifolia]|uniref:putative mitochondrial protein AtMg00310 n=1 Tax=Silene latifolia TaxID=37657 RepID=UPI003D7877C3
MVSKFWWGSDNGKRKMSWVAWRTLCRSKAKGGLGFRDFEDFNRALLAKQAWRLLCEDGSLMGRVLKGKYFPNCSFMDAEIGINPSYTWRSIFGAKDVMGLGVRRRVGSGVDVRVWTDPWVPGTSSRCVISPRAGADIDMRVAELLVHGEHRWDDAKISELFLPFEAERIRSIRLGDGGDVDSWVWDHTRDGEYSVKTGYRLLVEDGASEVEQSDFANEGWLWKAICRGGP